MNAPGRPGVNIRPASTVIKRLSSRNRVFALVICSGSSSEETADYHRSAVVDVPGSGVRAMRVVHRDASGRAKPVGCCGCLDHGPCGGYVDGWTHACTEQAGGNAWGRPGKGTVGGVHVAAGGACTLWCA